MPKKVLVADDEEDIVSLIQTALELAGYEVVSTSHGSTLFAMIEEEKPELLILDVMLPGIDGYSLQLRLSADERTKDIPVIIVTALPAARTLFEKFDQVKMFLSKPFDAKVLTNKVEEIIGK